MSVSQVHRQSQSLPGKDLRLRRLVKDLRNGHLVVKLKGNVLISANDLLEIGILTEQ